MSILMSAPLARSAGASHITRPPWVCLVGGLYLCADEGFTAACGAALTRTGIGPRALPAARALVAYRLSGAPCFTRWFQRQCDFSPLWLSCGYSGRPDWDDLDEILFRFGGTGRLEPMAAATLERLGTDIALGRHLEVSCHV